MTTSFTDKLPDLTIPTGSNVSNILNANIFEDAQSITLHGPSTLGADSAFTYTLEVSEKRDAVSTDQWNTLQAGDPVADVSAPGVSKSRDYPEWVRSGSVRLKSSANVTAPRTWKASKQWTA
jgi:hypothetical protein